MGLTRVPRCLSTAYRKYRLTHALGSADGGEGPARVAMLLRQKPSAGKAFCACLLQAAPVERVVDLVAALRDHLLSSAPAQDSALAAAEAGPSKGGKRRRGRKQMKAVAGSPDQHEEENAEVGFACLSMLRVFKCTKNMGLATMGPYVVADGFILTGQSCISVLALI